MSSVYNFIQSMATLEKYLLLSCGWLFRQYLYVVGCLISLVSSSSTVVKLQTSICSDLKMKSKKLHHKHFPMNHQHCLVK